MKISYIQAPLIWEKPQSNRIYFEEKINTLNDDVDLIILPEMFTTGFTMNPSAVAETMDGETIYWLKKLAVNKKTAITGSIVITENNKYYNRLIFVFPTGEVQYYNKKHLFTLAGEDTVYTPGDKALVVNYKSVKICLLVCYDLRFPVFSRNNNRYDILIYVANWPKIRNNAWETLLRARAIENMSTTIGVNRIGIDTNDKEYIGNSQAIDCLGEYIVEPSQKEAVFSFDFDLDAQHNARQKFGFLKDADAFNML